MLAYPLFLFLMIKIKYIEFIIWLTDLIYVVLQNPVKGGGKKSQINIRNLKAKS